jgi:hypothetical protein
MPVSVEDTSYANGILGFLSFSYGAALDSALEAAIAAEPDAQTPTILKHRRLLAAAHESLSDHVVRIQADIDVVGLQTIDTVLPITPVSLYPITSITVNGDDPVDPVTTTRGITGTVSPPGCPSYFTAATRTCAGNESAINSAIALSSAGDVIEVTSEPSSTEMELTGGPSYILEASPTSPAFDAPDQPDKILIRPPLSVVPGEWTGAIRISGYNIVAAGWGSGAKRIGTTGQGNDSGGAAGSGSWFWRCGQANDVFMALYDCDDAGFMECWVENRSVGESDHVQISASSTKTRRPSFLNCWFEGIDRPTGSTNHVDTLQLFYLGSGEIWHPRVGNCVLHGSENASIQGSGFRGTFHMYNNAVAKKANHGVNVDTNVTPNGFTLNVTDNSVYGKFLTENRQDSGDSAFLDTGSMVVTDNEVSEVFNQGPGVLSVDGSNSVSTGVNYSLDSSKFPPLNLALISAPLATLLDETNTGLSDAGALSASQGGITISSPGVYENLDLSGLTLTSGAAGSTFRNCRIVNSGSEAVVVSLPLASDAVFENCYLEQSDNGKVILGGGFTLRRCHVVGGEDGLHLNGTGTVEVYESIIEEQNHIGGDPHADVIQITTGPPSYGLTGLIVEDSILQCNFKNQNACLQFNVGNGPFIARRNWMHGGVYIALGDSSPSTADYGPGYQVILEDNMLAYDTTQFGEFAHPSNPRGTPANSTTGTVWWSRQVRPRQSGTGGAYTTAGEGAGFPGNGVAV